MNDEVKAFQATYGDILWIFNSKTNQYEKMMVSMEQDGQYIVIWSLLQELEYGMKMFDEYYYSISGG